MARLEEEPHVNPNTGTEEFSLRDPDGYYVTINAISAPSTSSAENLLKSGHRKLSRASSRKLLLPNEEGGV